MMKLNFKQIVFYALGILILLFVFYIAEEDKNAAPYVFVLFLAIGLFLILRELFCWYWKINKRIEQQDEIIQLLRSIIATMQTNKIKPEEYAEGDSEN